MKILTSKLYQTHQKVISAVHESQSKLYEKIVRFRTENGKQVELTAVYEDSLSSGSSLGTVIGFHGAPGSHKDFKYIRHLLDDRGVRFIGLNWPGFKYTAGYPGQRFDNVERQRFSDALLDQLELSGKIIMMGHSRGCENALITASSRNPLGLILINTTGLRIHRGSRPRGKLESLDYLHKTLPKKVGDELMYFFLTSLGFKVKDGAEAISAIRAVSKCDFERISEYIHKLNEMSTKLMITFGGSDHLVEREIVFEKLEKYRGLAHFNFKKDIPPDEHAKVLEALKANKGASVFVEGDNHFQNKNRANLIVDAAVTMLKCAK